ncbi:hypothetical protein BDP81DRAFT_391866 [Colletotrichum phormii]|uniref:Uncharacterized protein n=1 Tax=Colletotrichum phormii TaxID=359342 RepID=A0AAI9ZZQ5_9PEZI|nr:uncharacterized protein BDP81DRAFT_391866 [Colletotrichum phormii]KAK1639809.1 hypothetical protein BDP81DRAFT_391866 [Colletotrichum phormii]
MQQIFSYTFSSALPSQGWQNSHHGFPFYPPGPQASISTNILVHGKRMWNDNDSNTSLRSSIVRELGMNGINWVAIDVLRIGYSEIGDFPVVVFISVQPGSTSRLIGNLAAIECRGIIVEFGITDIHVEIKESCLVRLAGTQEFTQLISGPIQRSDDDSSYICNISDQLGVCIASEKSPRKEGTKGLYIMAASKGSKISMHLLLPAPVPILQPGNKTLETTMNTLRKGSIAFEDMISKLKLKDNMDPDVQQQRIGDFESSALLTGSRLNKYEPRQSMESRRIGWVSHSRALTSQRHEQYDFIADWALIALDGTKHPKDMHRLRNQLYVGTNAELSDELRNTPGGFVHPPLNQGTLTLDGVVPLSEILQSEAGSLIVGKVGRTSGHTWGVINTVKSVIRRITLADQASNASEHLVSEICVVGAKEHTAFSRVGDSGACVWDATGRVAGMLVGGLGADDEGSSGIDVTYITPISWILGDMEKFGLDVTIA